MKKSILFAALIFTGITTGNANAEVFNGPLSPAYTGYSIYYFNGTYTELQSVINSSGSLNGVPDGYKFLPWYGNSNLAKQFLTDWINGSDYGGGDKYPIAGFTTPGFVYNTNDPFVNGWFYNSTTGYDDFTGFLNIQDIYAVALSQ